MIAFGQMNAGRELKLWIRASGWYLYVFINVSPLIVDCHHLIIHPYKSL